MIHSTFRNSLRLGCAPGNCCSECAGHSMGDGSDTTDFTDFLAANPDLSAQQIAYQQANPGDPALQTIMYNPVTNTMGPVTLPAPATPAIPASPSGFSSWLTSNAGSVTILAVITGGLLLLNSLEGGPTYARKRR
jgi:hypothetical protein